MSYESIFGLTSACNHVCSDIAKVRHLHTGWRVHFVYLKSFHPHRLDVLIQMIGQLHTHKKELAVMSNLSERTTSTEKVKPDKFGLQQLVNNA